jgi:hypothetical protein
MDDASAQASLQGDYAGHGVQGKIFHVICSPTTCTCTSTGARVVCLSHDEATEANGNDSFIRCLVRRTQFPSSSPDSNTGA